MQLWKQIKFLAYHPKVITLNWLSANKQFSKVTKHVFIAFLSLDIYNFSWDYSVTCVNSPPDTKKPCPYLSSVPCTSCRCCPSRSHCCPHWTRPLSASPRGAPLHCSQDQGRPPRSWLVDVHDYQMTLPLPCTFQDCSCLFPWPSLFWQYLSLAAHHLFLYWRQNINYKMIRLDIILKSGIQIQYKLEALDKDSQIIN